MFSRKIRSGALAVAAFLMAVALAAPARAQQRAPLIDLGVTYAATHSNTTAGNNFWFQGGALELNARFFRGFGLMGSATGLHSGSDNPTSSAPVDMFTIAFGPSYTFHPGHKMSLFGEALAGQAYGIQGVFPYGSGAVSNPANGVASNANSLAVQTGGGLDLRLSRSFAIRALQVDYLRTALPNGSSNVQNNLRIAAGIVVSFGR